MAMAVIAGDIEGGGLLKRLGVLFTDHVLFDGVNNDLVVDTDSMFAGVARPGQARALFDQGPEVSHFRYFVNDATRRALRSWLTEPSADAVAEFTPLPALGVDRAAPLSRAITRDGQDSTRPIVVLLPGIMGSHLWRERKDRVWFDFDDLLAGGLRKIRFDATGIEAEALFGMFYGDLAEHLEATHEVVRLPYDWRLPLDQLGSMLGARLRTLLDSGDGKRPVRILAHSMGGLVVRSLIHQDRALWDALMARPGARFVMLGTPNQGSHLMVETLIGKSSTIRSLGRMDLKHSLQGVLDIVGGFPGALQLLPRPGFQDTGKTPFGNYFDTSVWKKLKAEVTDFWFGDHTVAMPSDATLQAAAWLWFKDAAGEPLPRAHAERVVYVHGCATTTPCGLVNDSGRWKMLGTAEGDGSVTWASGAIEGIGTRLWMPAEHGALADTEAYFDSLVSLLERGEPGDLMTAPPRARYGGRRAGGLRRRPADLPHRRRPGRGPDWWRAGSQAAHSHARQAAADAQGQRVRHGPAHRHAPHFGWALRAGHYLRRRVGDRPRPGERRTVGPLQPRPVCRPAWHRDRGAECAQRGRAAARQPARRRHHGSGQVRRLAQCQQADRSGAHGGAAHATARGRHLAACDHRQPR
jgi:hypothetical protein